MKELDIICYKLIIKEITKINYKLENNKTLNMYERELKKIMDNYINYVANNIKENEE